MAQALRVPGAIEAISHWQGLQAFWRAVWPAVELLIARPRMTALAGDTCAGAVDCMPEGVRAGRIEAFVSERGAELGSAAYAQVRWTAQRVPQWVLPPSSLDLAIAEVEADARLSTRAESFVRRLRMDEERLVDMVLALRPGGVLVALVHGGAFERPGGSARERLHELADMVAMAKLPGAWLRSAAVDAAPVDLILLRRRSPDELMPGQAKFLSLPQIALLTRHGKEVRVPMNGWYRRNVSKPPVGIFGTLGLRQVSASYVLDVHTQSQEPIGLDQYLLQAIAEYAHPRQSNPPHRPSAAPRQPMVSITPAHGMRDLFAADSTVSLPIDVDGQPIALLPGRLLAYGSLIYEVTSVSEDGIQTEALDGLPARSADALFRILKIRDALCDVLHSQVSFPSDESRQAQAREHLNVVYDGFVARHGFLNEEQNRRLYATDPDAGRLAALEIYGDQGGTPTKAEVFSRPVIDLASTANATSTLVEALSSSLNARGRVDLSDVARRLGADVAAVEQGLTTQELGYLNPETREWQIAAQYLSGDVVTKLSVARAWAQRDERFKVNVDALEAIQPHLIPADQISVRLGAPWLPEDVVEAFLDDLYGAGNVATVSYQPLSGVWSVEFAAAMAADKRNVTEFGTDRRPFPMLLESALNQRSLDVHDTVDGQSKLNVNETLLAHERLAALETRFTQFLWSEADRRARLAQVYNETYNRLRAPKYDGSHLTFPGMSREVSLQRHQRNAVWRFLLEGNLLLGHAVGGGKTFTQVACAMEARRLGRAMKPAWAVPDHLIDQADRQARRLYPLARILAVTSMDLQAEHRERTLKKISTNDWDLVIYSYTAFGGIRHDSRADELIQLQFEEREASEALRVSPTRVWGVLHLRLAQIRQAIRSIATAKEPPPEEWRALGHDMLLVDEAHNFRNLGLTTGLQVGVSASQRAEDLFAKITTLYRTSGTPRGVVFATGTPLSNSLLELYNLQRYLVPQALEARGLSSFRIWSRVFLKPVMRYEPELTGEGFRARTRYVLENAPEALALVRNVMDIVAEADMGFAIPEMETINIVAEMSPAQKECMSRLRLRLEAIRGGRIAPEEDSLLKIVTDGRKLGLDARLVDPAAADWWDTKIARLVQQVKALYDQHAPERGVQIIFCDMGVPNRGRWSVYQDVKDKLIAAGIPAGEIAWIHDYDGGRERAQFFHKVRARLVRVAMGSTPMMGEGSEMQTYTVAVHHLDAPWRPSDIEQRDGRARREGNWLAKVGGRLKRFIYTTKDTFDRYMWDVLRFKAETFSQLLRGDQSIRSFDFEVDPSYAETVAITTGNPLIKAKVQLEDRLARLRQLSVAHAHAVAHAKTQAEALKRRIEEAHRKMERLQRIPHGDGSGLWTYEPERDGLPPEAAFQAKNGELMRHVPALVREFELTELRGLRYEGVVVRVEKGWDLVADGPRLEWYLQLTDGSDLRCTSSGTLCDAVSDRSVQIADLNRDLARDQDNLAAREKQASRLFPQERRLTVGVRALKIVEEMIRMDTKEVPNHVDIEVLRELRRLMMGADGAVIRNAEPMECDHDESNVSNRARPARQRRVL